MKSRKTTVPRSKTPKIMTHKNQKIEKKKEYNPFATRVIKRETVGEVKCYLRAVKPNPKDGYGVRKLAGTRYAQNGFVSALKATSRGMIRKRFTIMRLAQATDRIASAQRVKTQKERSRN